jgi:hypothetical protein
MAKKSKNPVEVLREQGVDLDKLSLPADVKGKYDAYKQRLADQEAGYKEGMKAGKSSLPRRAAGALLVNPVTKGLLIGGLTTYGALTAAKLAGYNPDWMKIGVLDTASERSATWLRSWTNPARPTP